MSNDLDTETIDHSLSLNLVPNDDQRNSSTDIIICAVNIVGGCARAPQLAAWKKEKKARWVTPTIRAVTHHRPFSPTESPPPSAPPSSSPFVHYLSLFLFSSCFSFFLTRKPQFIQLISLFRCDVTDVMRNNFCVKKSKETVSMSTTSSRPTASWQRFRWLTHTEIKTRACLSVQYKHIFTLLGPHTNGELLVTEDEWQNPRYTKASKHTQDTTMAESSTTF